MSTTTPDTRPRFIPDAQHATHFLCRDCDEYFPMDQEHGIPNGQMGVRVPGPWCVVMCFCRSCWEKRYAK